VLSCLLIVSRHARRFVLLPASRLSFHHRHSQPSKSHQIISFADPHPSTLLESYRFKNIAGRQHSRRSGLRKFRRANFPHSPKPFPYLATSLLLPCFLVLKSFSCNTYAPPCKCCKQKTYGSAKPFRCNTYKKHRGGGTLCSSSPSFTLSDRRSAAVPERRSRPGRDVPTLPIRQASTHRRGIIGPAASVSAKKASQE